MNPAILAAGAVTSVGTSALQTFTSVRAGLVRLRETSVCDAEFEPVVMGLVPAKYLPPLAEALDARGTLTARQARMLRLAHAAWDGVADVVPGASAVPLYLGAPETLSGRPPAVHEGFLDDLAAQCAGAFDRARSLVFADGRAAAFTALDRAVRDLREGVIDRAWVGGVDTHLDLFALATLDRDERLKTARRMEGFHPGEGAAFVLLGAGSGWCDVTSVGLGREAGHLGSDLPLLGDGLADAVRDALAGAAHVTTVLAGMNGEYLAAKEWGVAARRNHRSFAAEATTLCPAESYGDAGAATGALLVALAAVGLARGAFRGAALAWAASDGEARGAALLTSRSTEMMR